MSDEEIDLRIRKLGDQFAVHKLATLASLLRAAAMMANRLTDGSLSPEDHMAIRKGIDNALVILSKKVD